MKRRNFLPALFAGMGGCLAAFALAICLTQRDAEPRLLVYPQEAADCAEGLLASVCTGNFQEASRYLYGEPGLSTGTQQEGEATQYLWDAFVSSLSYELQGSCYAAASGVAQDATVTGLDMSQVLQDMKRLAPELLEQRVSQAKDMDEVYDAGQEYREDFIQSVMLLTAQTALAEAAPISQTLTLNLVYDTGTWRVVPDETLLSAISGGILE